MIDQIFVLQLRAKIVCAPSALIAENVFQLYAKPEAPSDKALDRIA
ncbi:hypothetical protein [Paraburkholderia phytofirmans]|uniref:Uncharacterized protein n=1 Tax=Paraburkholderia phytofirmans TaxID=261302 RepID=A0ABW9BGM6_9BURK|nr:hypothetical protein [Paraburkholderia phytofirmans]